MKTIASLLVLAFLFTACSSHKGSTSYHGHKGNKNYRKALQASQTQFHMGSRGKCNRYH